MFRGSRSGHAFIDHVVSSVDPHGQRERNSLDICSLKKWVLAREIGIGAAKTRHARPWFGRMLVPQEFVARPRYQRASAAHMEKETAHFAEVGLFHPVLVIFIAGTALMNRSGIPLKRALIIIEFEFYAIGSGNYRTGDDIMMTWTTGQVDHRLAGFGGKVFTEKTAPFFFGVLQAFCFDDIVGAKAAERGASPDRKHNLSLGGQVIDQLFFGMTVSGMEHAGTGRAAYDRAFHEENIKRRIAGNNGFLELLVFLGRDIGN